VSIYSPAWLQDAACIGADPEIFFAEVNGKFSTPRTKQAIKLCQECPVRLKCLAWALETGDGFAVLGGMTPLQRTKYRRELAYSNTIRRMM
jgi:WhiB family transcriptional regulator, redox-sensing transcriptional regulator